MVEHRCPAWAGYFLANRLRMLLQNPHKILAPYVKPGMTVLDFGSAMGFFSLPMAQIVGPAGKVVCVDVQAKMLNVLRRRAAGAGLAERIETHLSSGNSIDLKGYDNHFDFALAFAVMHEVEDQAHILGEIHELLKGGAPLLLAEPRGHVSLSEFERTLAFAGAAGFVDTGHPEVRLSHAAILTKPAGQSGAR